MMTMTVCGDSQPRSRNCAVTCRNSASASASPVTTTRRTPGSVTRSAG
jgi:hypothetical protein